MLSRISTMNDSSKKERDYRKIMQKHVRSQQLRKTREKTQRRQKHKKPRRKNWASAAPDDWDELENDSYERVMPRGEHERRQTVEKMAFEKPSEDQGSPEAALEAPEAGCGTVVEVSSGLCRVALDDRIVLCSLRGALKVEETGFTNVVAVGDEVLVSENDGGNGVIEAVLPRRSMLARPDVFNSHLQQVVVANVDQVLIVASWREPNFWPELVDRYLIASERNHLLPVLCVNKMDLVEDEVEFNAILSPYRQLGVYILLTSAQTSSGIEALQDLLHDRTTVLAGLSGVGKSSLLTAVQPGLELRTREIGSRGANTNQGRHTTTQVTLMQLDNGGLVIDTPGMREFGLAGIYRHELAGWYPEIAALAGQCQYHDCAHIHEPDCAVQAAAADGTIPESRYQSYCKIYGTLPERG
jgi:ribosome biogenesis GTPase